MGVVTLSQTERNLPTTANVDESNFKDLASWLIVQIGPISLNVTTPDQAQLREEKSHVDAVKFRQQPENPDALHSQARHYALYSRAERADFRESGREPWSGFKHEGYLPVNSVRFDLSVLDSGLHVFHID